jgi:hypothetical protein
MLKRLLLLALFLLPVGAAAQVMSQNQVVLPPFGGPGFIVSTTTGNAAKLSATSTPYFANFFAGNGTIQTSLKIASLSGILKATAGTVGTATNGTDYTLITAKTCSAGDFFSAITAGGVLTCGTPPAGGSSVWPFTTSDTNYGVAVQSTTTPEWFKNGLHASSTSQIAYASTTALSATTIYAANFIDTSFTGNDCIGESSGVLGQATNCVSSLASANGSLTISSPTGNVDASLNLAHANIFSALQSFANASTSQLSVFQKAYFGATATSSFDSVGALTLATPLTVANGGTGRNSFTSGQLLYGNLTNGLSSVATGTISGSTGLSVTAGQSIIGSGLTITNTGVTSNVAGAGIAVSGATGAVTITNTIGYPFNVATNATSTKVEFNGGLTSYASTTIGGGATTTGLTISGNSTTTGVAYFATRVGIGTSTPYQAAPLTIDSAGQATNTFLTGSVNGFMELNLQNRNNGSSASTDLVATANNGTATTHYIDLGINSSGGGGQPFTTANHSYLYSVDDALNIGALGASAFITFNTTGGIATPAERVRIDSTGNVGIGSTTPGTLLSLGNTGANTINLSPTATSTFGSGLNIRTGCFAINSTCLSSGSSLTGSTGQVAYFSAANTAAGTSTLTIDTTSRVGVASTTPSAQLSVGSPTGYASTTTYAADGTYVPSAGVQSVTFRLWGGGGAGGSTSGLGVANAGGGSAAYVVKTLTGPSGTYTITLGKGATTTAGAPGYAKGGAGEGSGGNAGGGSTGITNGGVLITCAAGGGGAGQSTAAGNGATLGGAGGAGGSITGQVGGGGGAATAGSAGAGSTGGAGGTGCDTPVEQGNAGAAGSASCGACIGGGGASSGGALSVANGGGQPGGASAADSGTFSGGGNGGSGGGSNGSPGSNGNIPGGGGGGGSQGGTLGNGADGQVIITEFFYKPFAIQNASSTVISSPDGSIGMGTTTRQDGGLSIFNGGTNTYSLAVFGPTGSLSFGLRRTIPNTTAANSLCIDSTGIVTLQASNNCLSSLRKNKYDILSSGAGLSEVLKLQPVTYFYKKGLGPTTEQLGLIADDAAAVDVHFGSYNNDGTLAGIDDRALIAALINSVKELAHGGVRSAEENWQWGGMLLLALMVLYQQVQIRRLKK